MQKKVPVIPRERGRQDYGTVWTMRRSGRIARCALLSAPAGKLELRVLVDDGLLLAERCARIDEAFSLSAEWKRRMLEQGWRGVSYVPAEVAAAKTNAIPG